MIEIASRKAGDKRNTNSTLCQRDAAFRQRISDDLLKVPTDSPDKPLIYAVDDAPYLVQLYSAVLRPAGFILKTFTDRADALATLRTDECKPTLLITDFHGVSMSVEEFMSRCRVIHPSLKILMVTGFDKTALRFCRERPDQFLQKPFALDELQRRVRAVMSLP